MPPTSDYQTKTPNPSTRDEKERSADAFLVQANLYFSSWDLDQALASSKRAMNLFREINNEVKVADALRLHIRTLGSQEYTEEADTMTRTELARFRSIGNTDGQAKMLLLQAEMSYNREDSLEESLGYAREAEELFGQGGNVLGRAQAFMVMAEANMAFGKCKAAAHPAQKACRLFRQAGDQHEQVRAFLMANQADVTMLNKGTREGTYSIWDDALNRSSEAVKQAQDLGDFDLMALALCQLSEVHGALGSYDDAIDAAKQAEGLYHDHGTPQDVVSAMHWRADAHVKAERYKEAREVAEGVKELAKKHADESLEDVAQAILDDVALATGMADPKAPGKAQESPAEKAPPQPHLPKLVRNQNGEVMELYTGMTQKAVPMTPMNIADITAKILASYVKEEYDNEVPLLQAGLVSPMSLELQNEFQRKYMASA